jgi:hypothetical protein
VVNLPIVCLCTVLSSCRGGNLVLLPVRWLRSGEKALLRYGYHVPDEGHTSKFKNCI